MSKSVIRGWTRSWPLQEAPDCIPSNREKIHRFITDALKRAMLDATGSKRFTKRLGRKHHVLEIGSGPGVLANEIKDGLGVHMTATDPAKVKPAGKLKIHRQSAESLRFPDKTFSAVVSSFVLEYTHRKKALAQLHRVLKDDGRAIFVLHRQGSPIATFASNNVTKIFWELRALEAIKDHMAKDQLYGDTSGSKLVAISRADTAAYVWRDLRAKEAPLSQGLLDNWLKFKEHLKTKKISHIERLKEFEKVRESELSLTADDITRFKKTLTHKRNINRAISKGFADESEIHRTFRKNGFEVERVKRIGDVGFGVVARKVEPRARRPV